MRVLNESGVKEQSTSGREKGTRGRLSPSASETIIAAGSGRVQADVEAETDARSPVCECATADHVRALGYKGGGGGAVEGWCRRGGVVVVVEVDVKGRRMRRRLSSRDSCCRLEAGEGK